jgi:hypothetical protein
MLGNVVDVCVQRHTSLAEAIEHLMQRGRKFAFAWLSLGVHTSGVAGRFGTGW